MWLVGLLLCYKSKGYGIRYRGFNLVAWLRLVAGVGIGAGKLGCSLRASV